DEKERVRERWREETKPERESERKRPREGEKGGRGACEATLAGCVRLYLSSSGRDPSPSHHPPNHHHRCTAVLVRHKPSPQTPRMQLLRVAWALTGAAICCFLILLIHSRLLKEVR
ncbi:hypothetical protein AMECASPLE_005718, partial [Ameca splendens]